MSFLAKILSDEKCVIHFGCPLCGHQTTLPDYWGSIDGPIQIKEFTLKCSKCNFPFAVEIYVPDEFFGAPLE